MVQSSSRWVKQVKRHHDVIHGRAKQGIMLSSMVLLVIYSINASFLGIERANRELLLLDNKYNSYYRYVKTQSLQPQHRSTYDEYKKKSLQPSFLLEEATSTFPTKQETCRHVQPIMTTTHPPLVRTTDWTVVLSTNFAFVDFFQNWWEFYLDLAIHASIQVLVLAEDDHAYDALRNMTRQYHNAHFVLVRTDYNTSTPRQSEGHNYGSRQYQKLMVTRPSRLLSVACSLLPGNNNLIFADVDSVWKKNPLPLLQEQLNNYDLVAQVDDPLDTPIGYCAGFLAMKVNTATLYLLAQWDDIATQRFQSNQLDPGGDQTVLRELVVNMAGLRHHGLDMTLFPPGRIYFNTTTNATRNKAVVVHNNWIVGRRFKEMRFQQYGLWKLTGRGDRVDASDPYYRIKKLLQQAGRSYNNNNGLRTTTTTTKPQA